MMAAFTSTKTINSTSGRDACKCVSQRALAVRRGAALQTSKGSRGQIGIQLVREYIVRPSRGGNDGRQVRPLDREDGAGAPDDRPVRGGPGARGRHLVRRVELRLRHAGGSR